MLPIEFFWRAVARYPERIAVRSGGWAMRFAELGAAVATLAARMQSIDPALQSRVGIGAANSPEHLVALLATLATGKVWVPLNPRNGDPELAAIVRATEPTILCLDEKMAARVPTGGSHVISLSGEDARVSGAANRPDLHALALDAAQAIKFTGGTTGNPKGVVQPARSWNANIVSQWHGFGFGGDDGFLFAAPMTHGASTYILPILGMGGSLVFPEEASVAAYVEAIRDHAITCLFAPPIVIDRLVDAFETRREDARSLRNLIYGGAAMRRDQIERTHELLGPVLATSYGQTEAPQIITCLSAGELGNIANIGSVGRPGLLTEVAILDAEGRSVGQGEVGEIAVRGDLIMSGYWRDPERTAETIVGGWLHTGDIGLLDDRGYLFLRDRSRDVVISGGFNVYPSDVEAVLGRHPAVADCAVFGIDDPKWGEAVHAAVIVAPGHVLDESAILAFVKNELGSVKTPKRLHRFESFPASAVGKVLKREIRDLILQDIERNSV